LTAVVAALVLIAGASTAVAIAGGAANAQTDDESTQQRPDFPRRGEILDEVLSQLVADGVITQAQADAVAEAMKAKAEEVHAQMRQWREDHPGRFERGFRHGVRLGALLDDGVIDEEELAEVPDDHWLKDADGPAAKYLEDGQVTAEELRQLHEEMMELRHSQRNPGDS
jgi:polyhydroxyalkanoate synthesis regulator phasin